MRKYNKPGMEIIDLEEGADVITTSDDETELINQAF